MKNLLKGDLGLSMKSVMDCQRHYRYRIPVLRVGVLQSWSKWGITRGSLPHLTEGNGFDNLIMFMEHLHCSQGFVVAYTHKNIWVVLNILPTFGPVPQALCVARSSLLHPTAYFQVD